MFMTFFHSPQERLSSADLKMYQYAFYNASKGSISTQFGLSKTNTIQFCN